jgi:hypothetical protein
LKNLLSTCPLITLHYHRQIRRKPTEDVRSISGQALRNWLSSSIVAEIGHWVKGFCDNYSDNRMAIGDEIIDRGDRIPWRG